MSVSYDIRNLKTKADADRKRADFFRLLKLQQKLNADYENAMMERSSNEQLGITPVKPKEKSVSEEKADETAQMQIADRNLRTIMKVDEAQKVLSKLNPTDIFNLNSVFKALETKLAGETNITADYFVQVFRRYMQARDNPDITNRELADEIQRIALGQMGTNPATGFPYTVAEAVEQLSREYGSTTASIMAMLEGMSGRPITAIRRPVSRFTPETPIADDLAGRTKKDLIKIAQDEGLTSVSRDGKEYSLFDRDGNPKTNVGKLTVENLKIAINENRRKQTPAGEEGMETATQPTVFDMRTFDVIPSDPQNARNQATLDSFWIEEPPKDLTPFLDEIGRMPVERIPSVSAYIVGIGDALSSKIFDENMLRKWAKTLRTLDQALQTRQFEFEQEEEVEIPLYGAEPGAEETKGRGMLQRYGSGFIKKPRYGRRIVGRGIEKQPETYKKFGRYLIYLPALKKGIFHLKFPCFTNCISIPKREISIDLKEFIEDMLENGTINKRLYEKLNPEDRRYFNSVAEKARIDAQVGISENVMKQNREDMKRFELVKGIVQAGNNSPEVLEELANWLMKFSHEGKLNKNQVQEILIDLIAVK